MENKKTPSEIAAAVAAKDAPKKILTEDDARALIQNSINVANAMGMGVQVSPAGVKLIPNQYSESQDSVDKSVELIKDLLG